MGDIKLDDLCELKIGVKRKQLIKHVQLSKLMVWEQVLLTMLYARQQFYEGEGRLPLHFSSRISLLMSIQKSSTYKTYLPVLTGLLDQGLSFISVVEQLKVYAEKNPQAAFAIKGMLDLFEDQQIAFASLTSPLQYSHYALKVALTDVIPVFQALLQFPAADVVADKIIHRCIEQDLQKKNASHQRRFRSFTNETNSGNIEHALALYEANEALSSTVWASVDEVLAQWMKKVFDLFSVPTIEGSGRDLTEGEYGLTRRENIGFCDVGQISEGRLQLSLDDSALKRYVLMGQSDELLAEIGDALKSQVASLVTKRSFAARSKTSLSSWYQLCRVLGLKNDIQIPRLVAAILDWDIRHAHYQIGFFHHVFRDHLAETGIAKQSQGLTTKIIAHCLLKSGDLRDFIPPFDALVQNEEINIENFSAQSEPSNQTLADTMMKTWSIADSSKERERFKKPRQVLEAKIKKVDKLLLDQCQCSFNARYPVGDGTPMPLWASGLL